RVSCMRVFTWVHRKELPWTKSGRSLDMIAVGANCDRRLCPCRFTVASGLHPPAELFAVQAGPDFEELGASLTSKLSLLLEQSRRALNQLGITGVLSQGRLELARGDQGILMFAQGVLNPSRQADEIARVAQGTVAQ